MGDASRRVRPRATEEPWCYVLVRQSGLVWDITGQHNSEPLAELVQFGPHAGDNQKFRLVRADGGWCRIEVKQSGLALDVTGLNNDAPLAAIVQYASHGGHNQQFRPEPVAGDGTWCRLRVRQSGLVLDVTGADNNRPLARLVQYHPHDGHNQHFRFIPANIRGAFPCRVYHVDFTDGDTDLRHHFEFELGGGGWGNREEQVYTGTNAFLTEEGLAIEARREAGGFTSARLRTRRAWLYGRVEVVARLPTARGTWPAIWMLPPKPFEWPGDGELDLMEHVGHNAGTVHAHVHTAVYNHTAGTSKGRHCAVPDVGGAFHAYTLQWDQDRVEFLLDGAEQPFFRFFNERRGRTSWPFDRPFQLILNVAVGGSWGGQRGVGEDWERERMLVRSITVYQVSQA